MASDAAVAGTQPTSATPAESIELMDLLAFVYLQNGLPDKAAVLLAARNILAPDDPRALLALALAQVRSAKPQRALHSLEQLALLGAMDASFHLVRAQALQALDRPDEAASAMRAFVALRNTTEPFPETAAPERR
jgi:Flp pilus assembly protein TadD